jgi:2-polyprenyl-3-methyl-5-hydroxy-6-metoxy-1,4-benzoquinol methylase
MSSPTQNFQVPSPDIILETLQAYQRTAVLRGAIELDIFTAIAEGNKSRPAIAARIQASEKGTRVICDYLTIMGFLTKENAEYSLAPVSAFFLNRKSPAYIGDVSKFLAAVEKAIRGRDDVAAAVRRGGTEIPEPGILEPNHAIWVEFARSVGRAAAMPAELLAKTFAGDAPIKVLDISASHGAYGIAFARHNPNAKIVGLDWPDVIEVAIENARKAGVIDRYSAIGGSAFEVDLGSDYDIVLIPAFLHHFDAATNEKFLRRVHAALAPGGMAITLEMIPNEDRVSPRRDAAFSLGMLLGTPGGDAYTFPELEQMFRNAGFTRNEFRELAPTPQRMVVSWK